MYAQRHAVDTAFYSSIELLGCHVVHTTFERDFAIGSQRQVGVSGLQDAAQIGSRKCARCAATEIKRADVSFLLNRAVGPNLHFLDQKIRVVIGQFVGVSVLVEHAVEATRLTKRHVYVCKSLAFALAVG